MLGLLFWVVLWVVHGVVGLFACRFVDLLCVFCLFSFEYFGLWFWYLFTVIVLLFGSLVVFGWFGRFVVRGV